MLFLNGTKALSYIRGGMKYSIYCHNLISYRHMVVSMTLPKHLIICESMIARLLANALARGGY